MKLWGFKVALLPDWYTSIIMKVILWLLYAISIVFITSGAFNYGFSRFYCAIPFMIIASLLAARLTQRRWVLVCTILFSLVSVAINVTLEKNPLVFPILNGGYLEVHKDGYYETFPMSPPTDGLYVGQKPCTPESSVACEEGTIAVPIQAGTRLAITGIRVEHPDFGKDVIVITESGRTFSTNDINFEKGALTTNLPIENHIVSLLGILMIWPILLLHPHLFS